MLRMTGFMPAIVVLIGALLLIVFAFQCSINWEGDLNEYPGTQHRSY